MPITIRHISLLSIFVFVFLLQLPIVHGQNFVQANGKHLITSETRDTVLFKGVCFGNRVWTNGSPELHHEAADYRTVKNMGMNAVRFYLNYQTFERDDQPYEYLESGWAWLDKNIAWAKKHNIYLLLNMHVPQGGFQSNGKGSALWENPENQTRLIRLWSEIAKRYKDEATIGGYDLVNEPVVTSSKKQWEQLATGLVEEIRKVDTNHLIIVERLNAIGRNWSNDSLMNFFLLPDDNILYEFHFYHPFEFTHQNTSWTGLKAGGSYPDTTLFSWPPDLKWKGTTADNPNILTGSRDWAHYAGSPILIDDPDIISLKPVLEASKLGTLGEVYFGHFTIEELDSTLRVTREVMWHEPGDTPGWQLWSKNQQGRLTQLDNFSDNNRPALRIKGTSDWATAYNNNLRFQPKQGYLYRISGWAKPEMVEWGAQSKIRLDLEYSPSGTHPHTRDRTYLDAELTKLLAFCTKHEVPAYLGEFGCYRDCFKRKSGGVLWVKDMLLLAEEKGISFTYHAYNEYSFGIFDGSGPLPVDSRMNKPLVDLFKTHLKPSECKNCH